MLKMENTPIMSGRSLMNDLFIVYVPDKCGKEDRFDFR